MENLLKSIHFVDSLSQNQLELLYNILSPNNKIPKEKETIKDDITKNLVKNWHGSLPGSSNLKVD